MWSTFFQHLAFQHNVADAPQTRQKYGIRPKKSKNELFCKCEKVLVSFSSLFLFFLVLFINTNVLPKNWRPYLFKKVAFIRKCALHV